MRISAGFNTTSAISSASGSTATVHAEVWMRPCVSVAGTRCTRCAPDSNLSLRIRALPDDLGDDFLVAAELARALRNHFDLPAVAFGEARIHAEQIAGKQRRFVAAGAGADFEKNVALVVRVFRQQLFLQLGFDLRQALAGVADFGFGEVAHRRVGGHLLRGIDVFLALAIRPVKLDHRRDFGVLARELAVVVQVGGDGLRTQQLIEFIEAERQLRKLGGNALFHSERFNW